MIRAFLAIAASAMVACDQEQIRVEPLAAGDDQQAKLIAAVDAFVAANRTPAAYATLSGAITALRPSMDAALARDAERRLLVLGLAPVKFVVDRPMAQQVAALALTVWPTLLAPPIEADALYNIRDPKALQIPPTPGEDPQQYLLRLCLGPLANDCRRIVPELQGHVVAAVAVRRATERIRTAIADCLECSGESTDPIASSHSSARRVGDPRKSPTRSEAGASDSGAIDSGWRSAVRSWEALDTRLAAELPKISRRADPDNWPKAGAAAEEDPDVAEAELRPHGELVVDGRAYGPNRQRIAVLRDLRGKSNLIALHIRPDATLEQVRAVLVDARKAGCAHVAVVAREPEYPYRRRAYYVAAGYGLRANLRPTDSLQLLLHAVDEVAGPGTVARVD